MADGTILLVEDDESARYILAAVLHHAGYAVVTARTATEGLALFAEISPALVLVDLGLPDFDGIELIRRIRGAPSGRTIPVIVVTVHAFEEDRRSAAEAGSDHFLKKPVAPAELLRSVETFLRPAASR